MATKTKRKSSAVVVRRGASPQVAKLKKQVQTVRASSRRRIEKRETRAAVTSVVTGVALGVAQRMNLELPFAGELGTAGVASVATLAAGYWMKNDTLKTAGMTLGTIALSEFVEETDLLDQLIPRR